MATMMESIVAMMETRVVEPVMTRLDSITTRLNNTDKTIGQLRKKQNKIWRVVKSMGEYEHTNRYGTTVQRRKSIGGMSTTGRANKFVTPACKLSDNN